MKKVISGEELQGKIFEAIEMLCGTVKRTIGPKGNNVIIDHSSFTPFITNDGVTIAQNIESEDEAVGAILQIAKEASIKTNEVAGDGTTTTLVLLEGLYKLSQEYLKNEKPIVLKRELAKVLDTIVFYLKEMAIKPTEETLKSIAKVSSNEFEIGELVGSVFREVKNKSAITIEEIEEDTLYYSLIKGYTFSSTLLSTTFLDSQKEVDCKDASLLLVNGELQSLESIAMILNDYLEKDSSIVIIANSFDPYFVNEIISLNLNNKLHCYLLQIDEYGIKQREIQKDIEVLTNAIIVEDVNHITNRNLGKISTIHLSKENIRLDFKMNDKIENYIQNLEEEKDSNCDVYFKEFISKRISMFQTGIAKISIGGPTLTERRERKMRLEDAICAVEVAKEGVLPGGGLSLLKVASKLKEKNSATLLWKKVLEKPFEQILINAGFDFNEIKEKIEKSKYTLLFNADKETFENVSETTILDPLSVVIYSLVNACSIASMLLTTSSLLINEYTNQINKVSDYTEVL